MHATLRKRPPDAAGGSPDPDWLLVLQVAVGEGHVHRDPVHGLLKTAASVPEAERQPQEFEQAER
jgi:hypothetical protein